MKSQEYAPYVTLLIGMFQEKIKKSWEKGKMMDKNKITTISQIISSMEDAIKKLEKAYKKKEIGEFEYAKRIILEFQEKLNEELSNEER